MTTCSQCGHEDASEFLYCPRCGTKATPGSDPANSLIGRTLSGKYRVEAEIGSGAMGTVYLGEHISLKKRIALKVLHPDLQVSDEQLQRFQREGIAVGKFNHPNAIQIFDFDRDEGGTFYLAMEFVEGSNLKVFLRRKGRLEVALALHLARQLLGVLAEAHRHGIVHRDLKPDNIMIESGSRGEHRLKVLDFGLSKLVDRPLEGSLQTQAGRIMGTPLYMSPEQCAGDEADTRSDLYAAGLILYEMVSGAKPFGKESTAELLIERMTSEAPSLLEQHPDIDIPVELDDLLVKALQRRREDRYESAEAMAQDLEAVPRDPDSWISSGSVTRSRLAVERHQRSVQGEPASEAGGSWRWKAPLVGLLALLAALAVWQFGASGKAPAVGARLRDVAVEARGEPERRYLSWIDEARAALRRRDSDTALIAATDAIGMKLGDPEAWVARGDVYRAKRDFDAARADYREALKLDGGAFDAHLGLGWIAFEEGNLEEAGAAFAQASELAPGEGVVLAAQGALAYREGRPEEAEDALVRAVTAAQTHAPALLYLGRLRLDGGNPNAAIENLIRARREDPSSWRAAAWLAEAYLLQGKPDRAEDRYRDAMSVAPGSSEVRQGLASLLLEAERFGEARELLEESVRRVPGDTTLEVLLAVALQGDGRRGEAIGVLEEALSRQADARAKAFLGILYHGEGSLQRAVEIYRDVLEEDENAIDVRLNLGLALFGLDQHREAAAELEQVLAGDPANLEAYYHLGLLQMDYLGQPDLAADSFEQYRSLGGRDPRVDGWIRRLGR